MNYILEINAFERRMKRQPLPTTAQLLWYKLMHFSNTHHWPEWFSIDNDRLTELLGSGSDQTVRKARQQLLDAGLLSYEKGVKGKPGRYKLVSVAENEYPESYYRWKEEAGDGDEYEGLESVSDDLEDITTYFGYTEALGRELKLFTGELFEKYAPDRKPNEQDERQVFHFIRQYDGEGPGGVMTFPREKKELLAYAFEQANMAGAVNWNYINGIYRNFNNRGIKTADDAYGYDYERDRRKNGWA